MYDDVGQMRRICVIMPSSSEYCSISQSQVSISIFDALTTEHLQTLFLTQTVETQTIVSLPLIDTMLDRG